MDNTYLPSTSYTPTCTPSELTALLDPYRSHTHSSLGIRLASTDDIPRIKKCNLDNLPENYPDMFFQRHLYTWPELSVVAEDSDSAYLVGYALARVELAPAPKAVWSPLAQRPRYLLRPSLHASVLIVADQY